MTAETRLMMTRMTLHALGTLFALFLALRVVAAGPMWMKALAYAGGWALCAALYLVALVCREWIVASLDERVRAVVREERVAEGLRAYRRRLHFVRIHRKRRDG